MTRDGVPQPRFLDAGDGGLVVEFGHAVSEELNARVVALDEAIRRHGIHGVLESVPTYRSLLVLFDPVVLARADLRTAILALSPAARGPLDRRKWLVPVCYGDEYGVDLEAVASSHGLSPKEAADLHASVAYRVYMIGFAPGFAYLGGLPERLHTSRRSEPRLRTPPSSVAIGGEQTAIFPPMEIVSGWHLIGRTPVRNYDPRRVDRPFLFESGDMIRFEPVSDAEYRSMKRAAEAGEIIASWEGVDG
jgi:5-oxoprolinase (ATP-hydrolysing) subunit B